MNVEDSTDRSGHVANASRRMLEEDLTRHDEVVRSLLAKGSIAGIVSNMGSTTANALILGQYEQVVRQNTELARLWLAVPSTMLPGFATCAAYTREAMRGERPWNEAKLSLLSVLEPVICLLLLGRFDTIAQEFEAVLQGEPLFTAVDETSLRPVLTRHLILASQQRSRQVSETDYLRCKNLNKSPVFKDYHLLMLALAGGEASAFNVELARRCVAFKKRKSSRLIHAEWGFGEAAQWCFDTLGTAICRLAHAHGLVVEVPDATLYPTAFWRDE
jgi:hypothetical protein